ncbi:17.3 kDa class I heat shock protein [Vitis vinifera]|uniref:17.3 kDa class I heat shock protein n=1 Tax=Vitis vinifera TaxID=29760 RepID=A0A438FL99_VITVI|nr:17.3 kDa class I heat shock protein [Vitis vinifera]
MSLIPSILGGGRRSNIFDPFSLDIWDSFEGFPFSATLSNIPSTADLPGLKKEEVKVEVKEGRVLQISRERSKEQEEKNDKWHRVERSSGKFLCRFRLPEDAKTDEVKASMENGVLTVTIPKEEVKKAEVKAIEISG